MSHNVWVCAVAGIGGLSNGATRNAKADQLRPVPRHNLNKENESNEDSEPRHCTNLLLAVVGPFSSLHSKPCLLSPVNVTPLFMIQACGGAFFFAYFLHFHYTEHTLCLALDVGCKCGLAMCVRFSWCHFTRTYNTYCFL